jgi:cytochrome b6-f complex iron-sulfur subunit
MKRRDFINWIGVSTLASSLPVAIAACTPSASDSEPASASSAPSSPAPATSATSNPTVNPAADPTAEFTPVGTTTELTEKGFLLNEGDFSEPVIVIQDPAAAGQFIALSAKCTHTGCTVAWQEDLFACPCHGSKFNPDGSVVSGPAQAPLEGYSVKTEGETVLVAAA